MYFTCDKCGSIGSDHAVQHSKEIDRCIDIGIIKQVEFINRNICKTMYSCEGDIQPPGVSININEWPKFEKWLSNRGYTIGYATDYFYGGDIGWGITMPRNTDISVWIVPQTLMAHVSFNVDYTKIFV